MTLHGPPYTTTARRPALMLSQLTVSLLSQTLRWGIWEDLKDRVEF